MALDLVAGLIGKFNEASVELHQLFRPRHDVTHEVASACRLGVDLIRRQNSGPELEIWHLSHEGLCDVKATSHGVLWTEVKLKDFTKTKSDS